MREETAIGGALGLLCSTELDGLGDQLPVRVLGRELRERLGDWRISPLARREHSHRADGGLGALPISSVGPDDFHLIVVSPSEPVEIAELPGNAVAVAVRSGGQTGIKVLSTRDGGPNAEAVPNLGVLANRLVEPEVLTARVQHLQQLGRLPEHRYLLWHVTAGTPLVRLRPAVAKAAELLAIDHVVVMPTGTKPEDTGWPELPHDAVVEDRLALIANAAAVVAGDEHVAAAAQSFERTWVLFDPKGVDRPAVEQFGSAEQIATAPSRLVTAMRRALKVERSAKAVRVLDEHLNAVARLAEDAFARTGAVEPRIAMLAAENRALRKAHQQLHARLIAEREAVIEHMLSRSGDVGPDLATERRLHTELAERHRDVLAALAAERAELAAMRGTKLYRWSRLPRVVYGKLRGR
ncbi:hypothetical protein SK854_18270 [Lentzea sp. BCCO 10_0061]|uniref:Uncharacterized protein n=1 Tax=Lentzea sokolovensis TaxID=3095429 RepID=A0ABU4UX32_9PSEU|nr:hypothetical protein [Lentzea sp. BCCO 10_0061]MDX8144070.1 hypothetical protein [Lentzea sp. BCCO 10_0061]